MAMSCYDVFSYQQPKNQQYSVYYYIWQRKAASLHIWEAGTTECLAFLLEKMIETISQLSKELPIHFPAIKRLIISAVHVSFSVVVEELQQQVTQSSTQREEIIRLKQELQLLRRDLALSGTLNSVFQFLFTNFMYLSLKNFNQLHICFYIACCGIFIAVILPTFILLILCVLFILYIYLLNWSLIHYKL